MVTSPTATSYYSLSKKEEQKTGEIFATKLRKTMILIVDKQGRIHGNPVADGWVGAVMRKPLAILEIFRTDVPTYRPTRQGVESRVRD